MMVWRLVVASTLLLSCSNALAQEVELGRKLFVDAGCHGCHMVGRMGTPIGPDLSRVGAKYPREYLMRWLRDPAAQKPTAHMPRLELTEEQVSVLAAYLASLR